MSAVVTPVPAASRDALPAAAAEALRVTTTLTDVAAPDAGAVLIVALERALAAHGMAVTVSTAARP